MPQESQSAAVEVQETVDPRAILDSAIEQEYAALRRAVEALTWKAKIVSDRDAVRELADEVLNEAVKRVLEKAETFDPRRSPHAWLLGFAFKVLQQRRERIFRDRGRTVSLDATIRGRDTDGPGTSLAERLFDPNSLALQNLDELLSLVPTPQQYLLRMAFADGMRGPDLARALGISEGAARARLSRAVRDLTRAYRDAGLR